MRHRRTRAACLPVLACWCADCQVSLLRAVPSPPKWPISSGIGLCEEGCLTSGPPWHCTHARLCGLLVAREPSGTGQRGCYAVAVVVFVLIRLGLDWLWLGPSEQDLSTLSRGCCTPAAACACTSAAAAAANGNRAGHQARPERSKQRAVGTRPPVKE